MGPVAMFVPAKTAQEAELAIDKIEGNVSFMLPDEASAPEVVIEKA